MSSPASPEEIRELRKSDVKTGAVLLVFSIAILAETLTFPMKDSWGGVENVWYVSPALFPLIVGSTLLVLSIVLLSTGIKHLKAEVSDQSILAQLVPDLSKYTTRKNRDTLFIIGLLIFYVYLLIPFSDFYLATVVFQLSLTARFLFDDEHLNRTRLIGYLLFAPLLLIILFGLSFESGDTLLLVTDIAVGLFALYLLWQPLMLKQQCEDFTKKYRYLMIVSLLIPLLLTIAFQYMLLVPMPTEGSIIQLMDIVRYDLF